MSAIPHTKLYAVSATNNTHYLNMVVEALSQKEAIEFFQEALDAENDILNNDGRIDDPYVLGAVIGSSDSQTEKCPEWIAITQGFDTDEPKPRGIITVVKAGLISFRDGSWDDERPKPVPKEGFINFGDLASGDALGVPVGSMLCEPVLNSKHLDLGELTEPEAAGVTADELLVMALEALDGSPPDTGFARARLLIRRALQELRAAQ